MNKVLFLLLFYYVPVESLKFNNVQSISVNLYYNKSLCHNKTTYLYDLVRIPVNCNCFTGRKKCIRKINQNIILDNNPDLLEYEQFLSFNKNNEKKCLPLDNQTYFQYQYNLTNQFCSKVRLIFSIIYIIIIHTIAIILYFQYKQKKEEKKRKKEIMYQRLDEIAGIEFDNFLEN